MHSTMFKTGIHDMVHMQDTGQLFVQYVACVCNENDPELVLSLTYGSAMNIIQQAYDEEYGTINIECDDDDD